MKKIALLAIAVVTLISCSDDDTIVNNEPEPVAEVPIAGTWKLTELYFNNAADYNNDGIASHDMLSETGCMLQSKIKFNEDKTLEYTYESIRYSVNTGNAIGCEGFEIMTGSYRIEGSNVLINAHGTETNNWVSMTAAKSGNELKHFIRIGKPGYMLFTKQ